MNKESYEFEIKRKLRNHSTKFRFKLDHVFFINQLFDAEGQQNSITMLIINDYPFWEMELTLLYP